MEKICPSEFFKDYQNCTSPKGECNLKSLKSSRVYVFPNCTRNHIIILFVGPGTGLRTGPQSHLVVVVVVVVVVVREFKILTANYRLRLK